MRRTLATLSFVLVCASLSTSQVIRVPNDQPTIQQAIDAATPGTTVLVSPGLYLEQIDFKGKAIEVRGVAGSRATTIDASMVGPVVRFTSSETSTSRLIGFTITGGTAVTSGGGIFLSAASPTLIDLRVMRNGASVFGAGLYGELSASPYLEGCAFIDNTSSAHAGAAAFVGPSSPTFVNCVFTRNVAPIGGACYLGGSTALFTNCTFTGNDGTQVGGAIYQAGGRTDLHNTILWRNKALNGPQIAISATGGRVDASFSTIEGGWTGTNILTSDPLFTAFDADDAHIEATSPCRDAGNANAPNLAVTDIDGMPRIAGTTVDIGADEFASAGYVAGSARPGGAATIVAIGQPGGVAIWAYSPLAGGAIPLPGINGTLQIGLPFAPIQLGVLGSTGSASLSVPIPSGLPPTRIYMQTLVAHSAGNDLTPLLVVDVR